MTPLASTDAVEAPRRWLDVRSDDSAAADVDWSPTLDGAYRELAPAVLGYFKSQGVDGAEDLVGDVFVSVAHGLRRFRGGATDLRRWVFTIARRRKVDHLRRLRVRRRVVTGDAPEEASRDQGVLGLDVDLVEALRQLTPLQRDVVVLRFVADLPLDDVARIVRRSTGAVKSLQNRALAQLAGWFDAR